MNKIKKIMYILVFTTIFLLIGTVKSNASELELNNLDFNVKINSDGSMDVTETWDIFIRNTNTLYKTFETDFSKYSEITNVTVKEITSETEKSFTKTNQWMYHVTKNYYYGTENNDGNFEIGWGIGLENKSATCKYEISYTVKDVITKYNDYAELYWQFVGKEFEIDADKITGTIYLPSEVSDKEQIRVWGHTQDLNGTIYVTDLNKIEFELDNFKSGRYVEIRALFPSTLISYSNKMENKNILQTVIEEETIWAEEANERRAAQEKTNKVLFIGCVIINIILIYIYIKKSIKYIKKLRGLKKFEPTTKLQYFRELPNENITPGEALKILQNNTLSMFTPIELGNVFSATILDLTLKGYLEIEQEKNEKRKEIITINILKEMDNQLKEDEQCIMTFIKEAAKGQNTLTLKEIEKYIKNHSTKIEKLLKNIYIKINNQLIEQEIINKEKQKEYGKYNNIKIGYILAIIFLQPFAFIFFTVPSIIFIIDAILCSKIAKKINVLTQKGVNQQEQLKGLKKFMEDFSMIDKKEVPELVLWEKYLVYATAFGIADKVIKQLKIVYPNFEEITSSDLSTYTYMNFMINTDFSKSFTNSISTSISSAYSSGTGGGGGFSGGGGGGRRPVEAVDGR